MSGIPSDFETEIDRVLFAVQCKHEFDASESMYTDWLCYRCGCLIALSETQKAEYAAAVIEGEE